MRLAARDQATVGDLQVPYVEVRSIAGGLVASGEPAKTEPALELTSRSKGIEIVGIEGGEHPAFAEPAYYDPRAMSNNRVILGAFNTGNNLPNGRSRVARVHVRVKGPGNRLWHTELTTSANADGKRIPAGISIAKAEG